MNWEWLLWAVIILYLFSALSMISENIKRLSLETESLNERIGFLRKEIEYLRDDINEK